MEFSRLDHAYQVVWRDRECFAKAFMPLRPISLGDMLMPDSYRRLIDGERIARQKTKRALSCKALGELACDVIFPNVVLVMFNAGAENIVMLKALNAST